MAKESFNWKSLFINDTESSNNNEAINNQEEIKSVPKSVSNKFPQESISYNDSNNNPNPFINEILGVYEKGFESLNLNDFDFFEMYKSVVAVGINNPQSYQMAFTMGKSIKSDLTKQYLLEKSKFYIDEINKVYDKYDSTGNEKIKELNNTVSNLKDTLTNEISDLEAKIQQLQQDLLNKKNLLSTLDNKNESEFKELLLKIEANNFAKNKILESINTVVNGINQYL